MAHVKKQVRDAMKARLATVAGLTSVHDFSRLARVLQDDEMPAAFVTASESVRPPDSQREGDREVWRDLNMVVKVAVMDSVEDAEDVLDEVCVAIEKSLADSSVLGLGPLPGWAYTGASPLVPEEVREGYLLTVNLNYRCSVMTLDSAPDANIFSS